MEDPKVVVSGSVSVEQRSITEVGDGEDGLLVSSKELTRRWRGREATRNMKPRIREWKAFAEEVGPKWRTYLDPIESTKKPMSELDLPKFGAAKFRVYARQRSPGCPICYPRCRPEKKAVRLLRQMGAKKCKQGKLYEVDVPSLYK